MDGNRISYTIKMTSLKICFKKDIAVAFITLIELQCEGGAQSTVRHKMGLPEAHVHTRQASEPLGV